MNISDQQQSEFLPEIRIGRIGVLKVHQISDEELIRLSQGSSHSLFLNLGISLISISTSFLISLITTVINSIRLFNVFVIITVLGFLSGIILIILWWTSHQPIRKLVQEIRNRMSPEGEAQILWLNFGVLQCHT